ncbi:MAG TPA: DUF4416 family protein [Candidatus Latescibacteria bacterium]|nr:DUF4416 family protein [Candidatus Latescibacterota bacterium]
MSKITSPGPVALIAALMARDRFWIDQVKIALKERFGSIDHQSEIFPFNFSSYYEKEMGTDLIKQFVSFEGLIEMDRLAEVKILTIKMEEDLAEKIGGELRRRVNIDPGYLSLANLVLATTKNYDHRIYLGRGIFAEVTLRYRHGEFKPLDWTYPDYRTDLAGEFFKKVREKLLLSSR